MTSRDSKFDDHVLKIYAVLDRLDYYYLFGVKKNATVEEIKRAYLSIAAKFHPDRNRDATGEVKTAIYQIFKRLNEANSILGDSEKRAAYDRHLAKGQVRYQSSGRRVMSKSKQAELVSAVAQEFFKKALDEYAKGNWSNAKFNIQLALANEGSNSLAEELLEKIKKEQNKKV